MPEGSGSDVDEVFERIGGFGKYQRRAYFLMSSAQFAVGLHTLILTFIGAPLSISWSCGESTTLEGKCVSYGKQDCQPKYIPTGTSIVDEVSVRNSYVFILE